MSEQEPAVTRTPFARVDPRAYQAQSALEAYVRSCGLEPSLIELVKLRASYINGCAYCVDMHTKDARADGNGAALVRGRGVA